MLGSTVLNHQQHVGLQKLSALAGITHSTLGPNKKYKFIHDDTSGESALACSCFRILENLELTCAVGQLVYETIQAHHKVYHTGSGSLLFLAGVWSRAALECFQRGISVASIISAMSEGMDICLDVFRTCSISLDTFQPHLNKPTAKPACSAQRSAKAASGTHRKLKLSRHFCEVTSENVIPVHQPKLFDITPIAKGLSHGCAEAMNLVLEASRIQSEINQDPCQSSFDVTKVVTCVLPGLSEGQACVLPGCVVLLPALQASVAHHLKEQHLKVALINGDLSHTYRHLGFNKPTGVQCVSDLSDLSSSNKEENWMATVVTLLLKLEVKLILVSGFVSEKLMACFSRYQILTVENMKASVLKAFASATGAIPVTYATQLSQHCVGIGVQVGIWRDLSSLSRTPSVAVNIYSCKNMDLVTVVLTSCVHGKLQALEDQFWACAYRLHHVLQDKVLLPGAGATEMLCIQRLLKQAEHQVKNTSEKNEGMAQQTKADAAANPYRGVVLHLMADGLVDYISTVMLNTGRFSKVQARTTVSQLLQDCDQSEGFTTRLSQLVVEEEGHGGVASSCVKSSMTPTVIIYDNLSVKQQAWRKALDLVFLVLQTDAEITTGTNQSPDGAQDALMLL
ncbi:uncharacterized protein V6R79_000973 [Siganus canaliculatus]